MKILMAQNVCGIAGSENYLLRLIPKMKDQGIEVHFIILYPNGKIKESDEFMIKLEKLGVKVYRLKRTLLSVFSINSILKREQYSLVHTHLIHADFYFSIIKFLFSGKFKILSTKHGYDETYQLKYGYRYVRKVDAYWLVSWIAERNINFSFAVSKVIHDLYVKKKICSPDKITTIHHGIAYKKSEVKETSISEEINLLMVGRLTEYKGHDLAISAFSKAIKVYPKMKLHIVGNGEEAAQLKNMVKSLGVFEKVIFHGYLNEPFKSIDKIDIMLFPSRAEGFGLVILESMLNEIPIIGFDVGAVNEIIKNDKNGLLVPPYDINIFSNKLVELAKDKPKRRRLAANGLETVMKEFSFNEMFEKTMNVYKRTLRS